MLIYPGIITDAVGVGLVMLVIVLQIATRKKSVKIAD
jgi:UPF0716 family protein affecting phage T7 exclusion